MNRHRRDISIYASGAFWLAVLERAIKTAAQSALATIGTTALLQDLDWTIVAGATALATLASVLTSIASAEVGTPGPGLGPETIE